MINELRERKSIKEKCETRVMNHLYLITIILLPRATDIIMTDRILRKKINLNPRKLFLFVLNSTILS